MELPRQLAQQSTEEYSNGDLTWTNPSFSGVPGNAGDAVSNGNINLGNSGGTVSGTIKLPNGKTYTAPNYFASPVRGSTPSPFDFAAAESFYKSESNYLGTLATTGNITDNYNNLNLSGSAAGLNVFNVSASDFTNSVDFQLSLTHAGATALVNVYGATSLDFKNHGYSLNGVDGSHVLYNFVGVKTINWNGAGINGSMLLPYADLIGPSAYGQIRGTLIANSFNTGLQLNQAVFTGNVPTFPNPVPEPASFLVMGVGAIGLFAKRKVTRN